MKKNLTLLLIGTILFASFQALSIPAVSGKPLTQKVKQGRKNINRRQQQMKVRKVQQEIIKQGI